MQRDDQVTTRLLHDAGISDGMTVLDVGCGSGNVTRLLAERVGPHGHVVGIDINERAIARARSLAEQHGVHNVSFEVCDLATPPAREPLYDAIVGRRVLMYVPDRIAALQGLARVLRPGGVAAFQEIDRSMLSASPQLHPLHDTVNRWLWTTVEREGGNTTMGLDLPGDLEAAELQLAGLWAEAMMEYATMRQPAAQRVRAILPRIVARGVATANEVDVDTLDARLDQELRSAGGVYVSALAFCAWATKPHA